MVGSDMTDPFHMVGGKPLVRIIIVQIRNPLIRFAPEFSEIMAGRRAGCQRQIDRNACRIKSLGYRHGNIVDTRDMTECLERRRLTV